MIVLPPDANPYCHYGLDRITAASNMEPWIRPFATPKEIDTFEELERAEFYEAI